jgi:hypothetical protein
VEVSGQFQISTTLRPKKDPPGRTPGEFQRQSGNDILDKTSPNTNSGYRIKAVSYNVILLSDPSLLRVLTTHTRLKDEGHILKKRHLVGITREIRWGDLGPDGKY